MLEPFEIKRRAGLYTSVVVLAGVTGAGFIIFAFFEGYGPFWWGCGAVLLLAAAIHALGLVGIATPIFVADEFGVRLRDKSGWVGLRWRDMDEIRVLPRQGLWSDPRIKVISKDGSRVYSAPLGFSTTASLSVTRYELDRRRDRGADVDVVSHTGRPSSQR